jgi:hypothetical protein
MSIYKLPTRHAYDHETFWDIAPIGTFFIRCSIKSPSTICGHRIPSWIAAYETYCIVGIQDRDSRRLNDYFTFFRAGVKWSEERQCVVLSLNLPSKQALLDFGMTFHKRNQEVRIKNRKIFVSQIIHKNTLDGRQLIKILLKPVWFQPYEIGVNSLTISTKPKNEANMTINNESLRWESEEFTSEQIARSIRVWHGWDVARAESTRETFWDIAYSGFGRPSNETMSSAANHAIPLWLAHENPCIISVKDRSGDRPNSYFTDFEATARWSEGHQSVVLRMMNLDKRAEARLGLSFTEHTIDELLPTERTIRGVRIKDRPVFVSEVNYENEGRGRWSIEFILKPFRVQSLDGGSTFRVVTQPENQASQNHEEILDNPVPILGRIGERLPVIRDIDAFRVVIGDRTCANNTQSKFLRCAVNPCGPCEGCQHYEQKRLTSQEVRSLAEESPTAISDCADNLGISAHEFNGLVENGFL